MISLPLGQLSETKGSRTTLQLRPVETWENTVTCAADSRKGSFRRKHNRSNDRVLQTRSLDHLRFTRVQFINLTGYTQGKELFIGSDSTCPLWITNR
ncbi:hypothetical protein BgiBS90_028837 [Biomphalaria glabrata]|nr:hypothetical protein BgiMline_020987 [Biomphalaria glabrata]KAI8767531.1 hypothetical protein BgiBS90_028837 [Biomphalaria glabrata]